MNKQKLLHELKQNILLRRIKADEDCENFIIEMRKNKDFDLLYTQYNQAYFNYLKSQFESDNSALKQQVETLKQQMESYLTQHNIDSHKLTPQYSCPICQDKGVVDGKICQCLERELNKKLSAMYSTQSSFNAFENANPAIMTDDDKKAHSLLKLWCEKYPNTNKLNICIMGGAGSGKTFLLECVANQMIKNNHVVCFKTAFELNELARLYHIGKNYDFCDCLNCELLIIDDLGTEPILKNVTKEYLYNLINTRQTNKLPTLISTNLSQQDILDRYDERIYSRLSNKNLSLNVLLTSRDKRIG